MKIDEISTWEAFQGVAREGNFSRAARALRLTVPQVSKRVAKLEDQLGVRLFQRSTRVVALTDEGKALLPKLDLVLEDLRSLEDSFGQRGATAGTVRVTSAPFVARNFLVPALLQLRKSHPEIRAEIEISESVVNLIEGNLDLAVRIHHHPTDSDLVYRKLAANRLVLCASPAYLKEQDGGPKRVGDLSRHRLLMLRVHRDCAFRDGHHRLRDFESTRHIVCEDGDFLTDLALKGFGILVRSVWDVRGHLERGRLVPVLERHPLQDFGQIYAVIPSRRLVSPRVRALLDAVTDSAEKMLAREGGGL